MNHKQSSIMTSLGFSLILLAILGTFFFNGIGANVRVLVAVYCVAFVGLIFYFVTAEPAQKKYTTNSFLSIFFVCYSIWLMVSPYFSTWFDVSRMTVWMLMLTPLGFFVFTVIDLNRPKLRILLTGYFSFGLFLFLYGLIHFIVTKNRPDGPQLDANVFAGILLFFLIPVVTYWIIAKIKNSRQKRVHEYMSIYIVFGFLTFFSTTSRSATLALFIVGIFLLIKIYREYKLEKYKRVIIILFLIIGSFALVNHFTNTKLKMARGIAVQEYDPGVSSRLEMWKTSLDIYKKYPLTGIGFGQFKHYYKIHRTQKETKSTGDYAHNDYLQFLLEGGLIQLGFIIVLSFYIIVSFFKVFIGKPDKEARQDHLMIFALLCTICVFFIQANLNFIFYMAPIAVIIGGLLAYINQKVWASNISITIKPGYALTISIFMCISILILFVDIYVKENLYAYPDFSEKEKADWLLKRSHQLSLIRPKSMVLARNDYLYRYEGLVNKEAKLISDLELEQFNSSFESVLRFNPLESTSLSYLGEFSEKNPGAFRKLQQKFKGQDLYKKNTEELYLTSLQDDPSNLISYIYLRNLYIKQDNLQKGYTLLRNQLYPRFNYGEQNFHDQFNVILMLIRDANKLGHKDDAIEYSNHILRVDRCNDLALETIKRHKPADCPIME